MRRKNSKKRPETDHLTQKPVRRGHKSSIASGKGKTAFQDRNKSGQKFSAQNTSAMPNAARFFQMGLLLYGVHAVIAALNNPERQNQHLYITKAGLEQLQKQQQHQLLW